MKVKDFEFVINPMVTIKVVSFNKQKLTGRSEEFPFWKVFRVYHDYSVETIVPIGEKLYMYLTLDKSE